MKEFRGLVLIVFALLLSVRYSQQGCLDCFTRTKLSDFNKGTRFQIAEDPNTQAAYVRLRNDEGDNECREELKCSSGQQLKMKTNSMLSSMKVWDDVKFVYYAGGVVDYCEQKERQWIMSGVFTGCFMTKVNVGGDIRVGHLDTSLAAEARCKIMMKRRYENAPGAKWFKPYDDTRGDDKTRNDFDAEYNNDPMKISSHIDNFGIVSPDGDFYTIWTYHPEPESQPNLWEIISDTPIKQDPLTFDQMDEIYNPDK